jgi:catechol 2,3-dioxygenase-like lactoylglutathione lyase family enzyme
MKRLHVHVAVRALEPAVRFYSELFGAEPTVLKSDYAKWRLDDPRVAFAISQRGREAGLAHLGIEVDSPEELEGAYARLEKADRPVLKEGKVTCCYARSEKAWVTDPAGMAWEVFHTTGAADEYEPITASRSSTSHRGCGPRNVKGRQPVQTRYVTAAEIARADEIDPKRYRKALRDADLPWHGHNERWTVVEGGPEHQDMLRVLNRLLKRG